jgi:CheY-like chemotaxis protein
MFVQERQALDRARGGLGLGLAIVKGLVEAHGGTVAARSDGPGRGTELEVRLPAAAPVVEAPSQPPTVAGVAARAHVLVVDDNEDAAALVAESLRAGGYVVRVAHDASEALQVCEGFVPAVALLDIGLPGIDGYELARRLRALPGLERVHLIALTGYGQSSDREQARAAGFDQHLVKPVSLAAIRVAIDAGVRPAPEPEALVYPAS